MLGGQSGLVDYSDSESDDDGQVQFDWKASLASAAPEVGSTSGHAAGSSVAQQVAEEMALALDIAPPAQVLHPMLRTTTPPTPPTLPTATATPAPPPRPSAPPAKKKQQPTKARKASVAGMTPKERRDVMRQPFVAGGKHFERLQTLKARMEAKKAEVMVKQVQRTTGGVKRKEAVPLAPFEGWDGSFPPPMAHPDLLGKPRGKALFQYNELSLQATKQEAVIAAGLAEAERKFQTAVVTAATKRVDKAEQALLSLPQRRSKSARRRRAARNGRSARCAHLAGRADLPSARRRRPGAPARRLQRDGAGYDAHRPRGPERGLADHKDSLQRRRTRKRRKVPKCHRHDQGSQQERPEVLGSDARVQGWQGRASRPPSNAEGKAPTYETWFEDVPGNRLLRREWLPRPPHESRWKLNEDGTLATVEDSKIWPVLKQLREEIDPDSGVDPNDVKSAWITEQELRKAENDAYKRNQEALKAINQAQKAL